MEKSDIIQLDSRALSLGRQEYAAYLHLREVFRDVALFGGCLREQYIRQNTPYDAPTNDIDVRVRNPHQGIHNSLERYLNRLPLNQKTDLPPLQKAVISDWIGLEVIRATNREHSWLFETSGNGGQYPIDLSLIKATNDKERVDHSILKSLRVPFSSIAFSNDGFSCHKDFPRATQEMRFSILRNDGLRQVLWQVPYYQKIKAKYPDLKMQNPEIPFLMAAREIKLFFFDNPKSTSTKNTIYIPNKDLAI